ncbi:MAG: hypothetical protein JSW60_01900 [Thermoplasmatales archaeon]|nr:MAG: hypothetical protein JSW60_01900 [Thermoplasmatales archaeon]
MNKKKQVKLTEGSRYKIISIGGREKPLETEGVFNGFATLGIDEIGLIIKPGKSQSDNKGKTRIVPLHAILAIDIIDAKEHEKKDDTQDANHYYG